MWCVVCLRGGCVLLLRRMYKPVLFSAHHFRGVTIPPKCAALMLEACRKLEDTCTAAKVVHLFLQLHPSIHQPHIITTSFHIWHHPSLPYMAITHPFHIWPSPIPSIYGHHPSLPYMAITHPFHICSHRSGGSWHWYRSPFLFPSGIPPYMACLVLHGTLSAGLCRGVSRFHLVPAQSHECSYTPPSPRTQGPPDTEVGLGKREGGVGEGVLEVWTGKEGPDDKLEADVGLGRRTKELEGRSQAFGQWM